MTRAEAIEELRRAEKVLEINRTSQLRTGYLLQAIRVIIALDE